MKIKLIGTTVDYTLLQRIVERCKNGEELEKVLADKPFLKVNYDRMGGTAAGICYMPEDYDTLANEKETKTLKRAEMTKASGHHSTHGHVHLNFIIEDCPKIVAMFLNNEKEYTTSEKSARYTKMTPSEEELKLYNKWVEKLKPLIKAERPKATDKQIEKLAMENARYMISVFTPTTFEYTTSYRQINYIYNWAKNMVEDESLTSSWYGELNNFYEKLKPYMQELCNELEKLGVIDLNLKDQKRNNFSLVRNNIIINQGNYNENIYSTTYFGSFAQLAQAQRHRSISYSFHIDSLIDFECFVPEILNPELSKEWKEDIENLMDDGYYPQGMKVRIYEYGTIEAFILKCKERLCSAAQYEIDLQTKRTLIEYADALKKEQLLENDYTKEIMKMAEINGPRCMFGYKCANPCGNVRRGKI